MRLVLYVAGGWAVASIITAAAYIAVRIWEHHRHPFPYIDAYQRAREITSRQINGAEGLPLQWK